MFYLFYILIMLVKYKKFQVETILNFLDTYPNLDKSYYKYNNLNKNQISFDEFVQLWIKYINIPPNTVPFYMARVSPDPIINSMESFTEYEKEIIMSNCGCIILCGAKNKTKYRMNLYLDKKTYGYTNQTWGNSNVESILQYAQNRNLPVFQMLVKINEKIYEAKKNIKINKFKPNFLVKNKKKKIEEKVK